LAWMSNSPYLLNLGTTPYYLVWIHSCEMISRVRNILPSKLLLLCESALLLPKTKYLADEVAHLWETCLLTFKVGTSDQESMRNPRGIHSQKEENYDL
jgi:hypothetical protein